MQDQFTNFTAQVAPATMDDSADSLGGLLDVESSEPVDITSYYSVAGLNLKNVKFLDLEYFKQGIVYFRPVINGFLMWLLGIYFYNQLLSFMGQAPHMISGARNSEANKNASSKKDS